MRTPLRQYYLPVTDHTGYACGSCGYDLVEGQEPDHGGRCPVDRLERLQIQVAVTLDTSCIGDAGPSESTRLLLFPSIESAREGVVQWARDTYGEDDPHVRSVWYVDSDLGQEVVSELHDLQLKTRHDISLAAHRAREEKRASQALANLWKILPGIPPLDRVTRVSSHLTAYKEFLSPEDEAALRKVLRENVG